MPEILYRSYESNVSPLAFYDDEIDCRADQGSMDVRECHVYTAEEHAEIEKLRLGHERYEKLRLLNVQQFQDLFLRNLKGEASFDSLVDALPGGQ